MASGLACCLALLAGCSLPPVPTSRPTALPAPSNTAATTTGTTPSSPAVSSPAPGSTASFKPCQEAAAALSLDARIGQLMMVGVEGALDASERQAVTASQAGSVVLLGRQDGGVKATAALVAELAQLNPASRLLAAADQEGGAVQRLTGTGFATIPSAARQAKLPVPELEDAARRWGRAMGKADVLLNLAPVADVVPKSKVARNAPIGALGRGYGSDPGAVTERTSAVITGLGDEGIGAAVKHFPGLGEVVGNTDTTAGVVDRVTRADSASLEPFRAAAKAGVAAVMVSSATYSRIDPKHQAVFSAKVIGLLRQWGYDQVVISDDLGAAAALRAVPASQRAVRFLAAGGDLVINADPTLTAKMVSGIRQRALTDAAFEARVTESAARMLKLKEGLGLYECG